MKHFLLSPEGLQRIADKDVLTWRLHGSFMKPEGPIMIPIALGQPDVECIEGLLKRAENFVYWFTPDYRVAFSTKDGKSWKMRFEVRGVGKDGKACIQAGSTDKKVSSYGAIQMIAEVFASAGERHRSQTSVDPEAQSLGSPEQESA